MFLLIYLFFIFFLISTWFFIAINWPKLKPDIVKILEKRKLALPLLAPIYTTLLTHSKQESYTFFFDSDQKVFFYGQDTKLLSFLTWDNYNKIVSAFKKERITFLETLSEKGFGLTLFLDTVFNLDDSLEGLLGEGCTTVYAALMSFTFLRHWLAISGFKVKPDWTFLSKLNGLFFLLSLKATLPFLAMFTLDSSYTKAFFLTFWCVAPFSAFLGPFSQFAVLIGIFRLLPQLNLSYEYLSKKTRFIDDFLRFHNISINNDFFGIAMFVLFSLSFLVYLIVPRKPGSP